MPNWVYNKIIFATKEDAAKAKEIMSSDKTEFDFNNVIPMPKILEDTQAPTNSIYAIGWIAAMLTQGLTVHKLIDKIEKDTKSPVLPHIKSYFIDPSQMVPVELWLNLLFDIAKGATDVNNPNDYKLGYTQLKAILTTGYSSWYEWCTDNWNTKWNTSEEQVYWSDTEVYFHTPWTPPIPVISELTKQLEHPVYYAWAEEQVTEYAEEYIMLKDSAITGAPTNIQKTIAIYNFVEDYPDYIKYINGEYQVDWLEEFEPTKETPPYPPLYTEFINNYIKGK